MITNNIGSILLGTVIANAELGTIFPDGITAAMFESPRNRVIFSTATDMIRDGSKPNLVLLSEQLKKEGKLEAAGGADYIAGLTSLPETYASQIERYGELLKRQAMNREAVLAVKEAAKELDKPGNSPEQIIPNLQKRISDYSSAQIVRQSFKFLRLDIIEVKAISWVIKGHIEAHSFICIYGDSGSGKSLFAIEQAACVATGTPFYGIPVKQGPVIYLAGEGHSGLARRFEAWSIARGVSTKGAPIFLSEGSIALTKPTTMGQVCSALEKLIKEIGQDPLLVILDTWSRVLGGDDSAPSDAAAGVAVLDGLRAQYGNFAVIVIHHEGHQKGRGRGWSGLRAAVDMEYRVERGADGLLRLECTKAKDTEPTKPMAFQFIGVELPIKNESGETVTSAVLDRVDWESEPKAVKEIAMGKNQAMALNILKRLATTGPVTVEAWREACQTEGMIRQRFNEAKKSLAASGILEFNSLFVTVRERTNGHPLLYNGCVRSVQCSTDRTDEKENESSGSFDSFRQPQCLETENIA